MKNTQKAIFVALVFVLLLIVSACSTETETSQDSTPTPLQADQIQGMVSNIVGNKVTIDLIKAKDASNRTQPQQNEFTGESKTIVIEDNTPIITITRSKEGVIENPLSLSSIAKGDILYIFYGQDGNIEKIRVIAGTK